MWKKTKRKLADLIRSASFTEVGVRSTIQLTGKLGTIRALKAAGLACRTVVGGAVVTQEYADSIGADFYAKDAMRTVRIAESLAKSGGRV